MYQGLLLNSSGLRVNVDRERFVLINVENESIKHFIDGLRSVLYGCIGVWVVGIEG